MGTEDRVVYTFHCPACEESLEVDDPLRDALIEHGCVVCGTAVTRRAFTAESTSGSG